MENNQNFEMVAGTTKILMIHVTKEDGSDLNINNCQIRWTMTDGSQSVSKNTPGSITVTNATGGLFEIKLLPADTDALRGEFYHECEITDASGDVSTLFTGEIKVKRGLF